MQEAKELTALDGREWWSHEDPPWICSLTLRALCGGRSRWLIWEEVQHRNDTLDSSEDGDENLSAWHSPRYLQQELTHGESNSSTDFTIKNTEFRRKRPLRSSSWTINPTLPSLPSNHTPRHHTYRFFEPFQGQQFHNFLGQPVQMPDHK